MVLDSTRARGATESPDKALASSARWAILALVALVGVAGLALAAAGAAAPLGEGDSRSVGAILIGLELAALGAAGAVVLSAPSHRRPLPAARSVDSGIELPVRAAHRLARLTVLGAVAALGLTLVFVSDETVGRVLGVLVALVGIVFAVFSARQPDAILLNPDGVLLPPGPTKNEPVAWRDVHEVAVTGGWRPTLVMTWTGPGLSATHISSQAWPPSALLEVIDYYRTHSSDRAALTDPAAVDQFRAR